ncbi:hypothetical protein HMPREF1870_00621 [Bacteroidales bacterium KA00344]|nr:hypothetical protein HMPREF1870_00621 [Bacteroidales bacterium KA00344]
MDFTQKRVVFDILQPDGAISNALGTAQIYIKLFKKIAVLILWGKKYNI